MNSSSSISSRERLPPDRFEGMDRAHHLLGTMPLGIHTGQESIDFRCLIDRTWETTEESNPSAGIDTGWEHGSRSGILRNTAEAPNGFGSRWMPIEKTRVSCGH